MKKVINLIYKILCIILIVFLFIINSQYNKSIKKIDKLDNEIKILKKEINNYDEYIFLGDSITNFYHPQDYFPEYKVINSGVGGNQTKTILHSLDTRVYKYKPSKVILLIGINDFIHSKTVNYVEKNIKEINKKIKKRFPKCDIYIESIYPVNNELRNTIKERNPNVEVIMNNIIELNSRIEKYCKDSNCEYIDIYSSLIDEDNMLEKNYSDDGLHLNEVGYEVVTKVLKQKLK